VYRVRCEVARSGVSIRGWGVILHGRVCGSTSSGVAAVMECQYGSLLRKTIQLTGKSMINDVILYYY
jgi:hypothetical protein